MMPGATEATLAGAMVLNRLCMFDAADDVTSKEEAERESYLSDTQFLPCTVPKCHPKHRGEGKSKPLIFIITNIAMFFGKIMSLVMNI